MVLTKLSCGTYFIVSVEVAHLSFPILLLAFMTIDDRETVECVRGQGSTWLGFKGYQGNQRLLEEE